MIEKTKKKIIVFLQYIYMYIHKLNIDYIIHIVFISPTNRSSLRTYLALSLAGILVDSRYPLNC